MCSFYLKIHVGIFLCGFLTFNLNICAEMTEKLIKPERNRYLSDRVLSSVEEDRFGHNDLANEILRILIEQETPLNIGVFGKWGVGKSSIVKFLEQKIDSRNARETKDQWKFIKTNVWKYNDDNSIRRKLMFDIIKEIGEINNLNSLYQKVYYDEEFGTLTSLSRSQKVRKFLNSLKNPAVAVSYVGVVLLVSSILALIIHKQYPSSSFTTILPGLISSLALVAINLPIVLESLSAIAPKYRRKAFEAEEQFESEFVGIVDTYLNKGANKKLVIFIDDLDRCSPTKVMKTLESVKTFLSIEGCVFIVACDPEIIKKAVVEENHTLGYTELDGSNYLEKFFQHTVSVAPFLPDNMREFAEKIIEKNQITIIEDLKDLQILQDVLFILAYDASASPRRLIVLINSFISDYYVASAREKNEIANLHSGQITNSPQPLAILTVLKNDFPFAYRDLQEYPRLLLKVRQSNLADIKDNSVRTRYSLEELQGSSHKDKYPSQLDVKKFVEFIQLLNGNWLKVDISPYLHLTTDRTFASIEEIEINHLELDEAIRNGFSEKVIQILSSIEKERNLLLEFVGKRLDSLKNYRERINASKVLSFVADTFDFSQLEEYKQIHIINLFQRAFNDCDDEEMSSYNLNGVFEFLSLSFNFKIDERDFFRKVLSIAQNNPNIIEQVIVESLKLNDRLPEALRNELSKLIEDKSSAIEGMDQAQFLNSILDKYEDSIEWESFSKYFLGISKYTFLKVVETYTDYWKVDKEYKATEKISKSEVIDKESDEYLEAIERLKSLENELSESEKSARYYRKCSNKIIGYFSRFDLTIEIIEVVKPLINSGTLDTELYDYFTSKIESSNTSVKEYLLEVVLDFKGLVGGVEGTEEIWKLLVEIIKGVDSKRAEKTLNKRLPQVVSNISGEFKNNHELTQLLFEFVSIIIDRGYSFENIVDKLLAGMTFSNSESKYIGNVIEWVTDNSILLSSNITESQMGEIHGIISTHGTNSFDYSVLDGYVEYLISQDNVDWSEYFEMESGNDENRYYYEYLEEEDYDYLNFLNKYLDIGERKYGRKLLKNRLYYNEVLQYGTRKSVYIGSNGIFRLLKYIKPESEELLNNLDAFREVITNTDIPDYRRIRAIECLVYSAKELEYNELHKYSNIVPGFPKKLELKVTIGKIYDLAINQLQDTRYNGVEYKRRIEFLEKVIKSPLIDSSQYSGDLFELLKINLDEKNNNNIKYIIDFMITHLVDTKPRTKKEYRELLLAVIKKYKREKKRVSELNQKLNLGIPKRQLSPSWFGF